MPRKAGSYYVRNRLPDKRVRKRRKRARDKRPHSDKRADERLQDRVNLFVFGPLAMVKKGMKAMRARKPMKNHTAGMNKPMRSTKPVAMKSMKIQSSPMRSKAMKTMAVKPPRRSRTQLDCRAAGLPCDRVAMDTEAYERDMGLLLEEQKKMSWDEYYEATAMNE